MTDPTIQATMAQLLTRIATAITAGLPEPTSMDATWRRTVHIHCRSLADFDQWRQWAGAGGVTVDPPHHLSDGSFLVRRHHTTAGWAGYELLLLAFEHLPEPALPEPAPIDPAAVPCPCCGEDTWCPGALAAAAAAAAAAPEITIGGAR